MFKYNLSNKILIFLFIFLNLIINFNLIFFNSFVNEILMNIIISLIILIFLLPTFFYYFNHFNYKNIPIVEIILLFFLISYFTIFALGSEFVTKSFFWLVNEISAEDYKIFLNIFNDPYQFIKIFYYGSISFLIGYYLLFFYFNNKSNFILEKIKYDCNFKDIHIFFLSLIFFFIKLNLFIFPKLLTFNVINQFKEVILIFLTICCSHTIFANKKLILRIISILIIIISFIISITETGSQIGITLMIISMVMICWFLKKKIFFLGILLIVFNFYFFQDIKIEYREKISEFSVELRAPITKISNFFDLSTKAYKIIQKIDLFELFEYDNGEKENIKKLDVANFQSSNPELDNKSRVSAARLSMSPVAFNFILNKYNKGQLNLKNGETYKPLLLFFIPRVLWPNKPISSFGIEYGITSGISNIDYPTSINLSWISESFWNFGEYFFIAMFFKGIILSFLSFLIIFRKNCVLFYSWLATIISLVIAENNFSLMISPIFFKFIFLIIIIQIYKLCFVSNEKNKIIS